MPTTTSQMNGGSRSKLPVFHSSLTSSSSPSNLKRTNDELRQHISRLKAELEIEKAKSKQIHRDKVADIKRLKDEFDKEKIVAHGSVLDKLKNEHEVEIKKLKDSLQKEKEVEIKQILKFKDEELRTTKKILQEDKDFSLREQEEKLKRGFVINKTNNDIEIKLRQELNECRKQKQQFEDLCKQKSAAELEKSELIRQLKDEHEKENQRVLRDARIQIARNVHELKNAQRALAEKEQEMIKRELELTRLEEQKEYLSDKIRADVKRNSEHGENGMIRSEKEKELQLKNLELRKTLDDITRKNHILEKEASLKRADSKDSEPSSRAEVRVKELKKRNGELVTLAKKLEEKAKRLQEELRDLKSRDSATRSNGNESNASPRAFENFKKSFTMQRAKDLAENARATMTKDKEIVQLKEKISDLEEQLKNNDEDASEVQKLQMIIHQIEKEKLKLEKQFAADIAEAKKSMSVDHSQERALRNDLEDLQQQNEQLQKANAIEAEEIKELQEKIERVQEKGEQCDSLVLQLNERNQEYEQLVDDLELRENECKELKESIEKAEKEIKKRETEREKDHIMLKNLHNKMADMSQRLVEMGDVENECRNLQERLSDAEKHCNLMTDQLETLQDKVSDFKSLEQDLKDCEEKCKKWERDYDFAVEEINKRNKEIGNLHETQLESKMSHDQEVEDLREEISRLEEICVDLEGKENEYKELLEAQASKPSQFNHVYVQTSRQHTPVSSQRDVIMEDIVADIERVTEADIGLEVFEDPGLQDHEKTDDLSLIESELEVSSKCEDDILDIASSRIAALAAMSSSEGELSREDPLDLDKYIQKSEEIMEDQPTNNQDKVHENQGKLEKDKFQFDDGDTSDELSLSLDEMESDDDDVIDAKVPPSNNNIVRAKPHHGLQSKPREHRENQSTNKAHPTAVKRLNFKDKQDSDSSIFGPITPQGSVDEMSRDTIKQSSIDESVGDSVSSRVDKLSVFIAKYTYDPFEHSPNDDPSLELSLEAGDYVYIFGEVDEDGFYTGELVNGQRGLVPSNFIEKIADENELIPISTGHDGYPGDESDEDLTEAEYLKSTPRPSSSQNINDVFNGQSENEDDITKVKGLPPPRKLKMERQLNNSIVISWLPPADIDEGEVVGYSIKADGEVKETVIGVNRTRAIVSDIHHDKVYRISVQCFDKQEQESPGSVATITIGRGASAVPSDLKIQNLSPTSADLEWACGNSSMLHAIYLDGREVHVMKPGIDKFKLTDLVPDHEYEVNVEARQSKDAHKKSNIRPATSRSLLFTTPKGGPPDPPLNVQAQVRRKSASHRQTSILISWLPVTITDIGTSNGAIVQGYKIYMNDNEAAIVDLPTSDHVDILANNLHEILTDSKVDVIELWVKTQSSLGESMISNVVVLKMDRHLSDEIYRGGKKAKDSEKQLGLERKLSTGDLKLPKEVDTFEKKPNLERKLSTEKAAKISKNLETQPAEVIEPAYASVSVLEVEATQTDPTGAGTFDLNRKDSDLDRKLNWIDQLAAAEEGKGRDVASKKKENESEVSKLEAQKEARKDELTKKATVIRYDVVDSDDSGSSDESDSDDEVPRVYNIMKEEEEETGRKASAKTESPTQDNSSKSSDAVPQENLILPTIPMPDYPDKSEDSQEGPEISLPDYPDAIEVKPRTNFPLDDLLSDSDSNSELSAIEEETIDELLAYNKDGSRCVSPGKIRKSASLDRARSGLSPDTADKTYSIHSDNGNKTYSLHSDEEKNRTFDREEKARVSDRKSSRTSKDTLTFSSDDVMDILDKDMIGTVPELPLDEEKNRKEADEKSKKKGKIDNEGNEKRNGTRVRDEKPSVETSKKPQTPEDSLKVSGKTLDSTKKKKIPEKSPEHETKTANQNRSSGKVDTVWTETGTVTADKGELLPEPAPLSPKTRALSAKTHAQNVIESDELPPAKQSPVATKDQPCVDARPELRKWAQKPTGLAQNELDFAAGEEEIIAKVEQLVEPVRFEERSAEDTDSPHELLHAKSSTADSNLEAGNAKGGADSKNQPLDDTESNIGENLLPEAHRDWKQTQELQYNETPAVTDNGSGFASNLAPERQMGQANVSGYNDSDIDVELQELDDESSIKIPLTSVHDLYTLNAVDSFDDSALESESDYKPYFTPIGVHENAEKEAVEANKTTEFGMGSVDNTNRTAESNFNDNSTSYLSMGPVIDDKSITETPIYKDIDSVEPVAHSQGDNEKDNNMNENNEISNADTRINHVEADTQSNNVRVFVALFSYDPITMSPNTEGVDEELTFNEGDLIKIFGDCDEDGFYYGELHDKRGFVPSNMVQEISLGDFGNSFNIPPPPEDLSGDTEENISQENFEHKSGSRKQSITTEGSPKDSQPQSKESSKSKGPRNEPGRSTDNTSEEQPQSKRISKRKGSKKEPCRSADKNNEGSVEERRNNNPKMEEIATELENMDLDERSRDYRYISERDSIYCLPPRRMIAMYDYDPAVSSPNVDSEVELAFNKGDIIVIFGDMDEDGFFAAQSESERGLVPSNFLEECPEPSDSEEIEINMGAASPSIKSLSRKSSGASITGASPVDSPKSKKKKSFFSKSKKIFSKLKGK